MNNNSEEPARTVVPSQLVATMAQQTLVRLAQIYASSTLNTHSKTLENLYFKRSTSLYDVKSQLKLINQSLCGLSIKKGHIYHRDFIAYKIIWIVYKTFIKQTEQPNQSYANLGFNPLQLRSYLNCELDINTFIPNNVVKLENKKTIKNDKFSHEIYFG